MSTAAHPDIEELLRRAARGDQSAVAALLQRHRQRLGHMVSVHMAPEVSARFAASDVIQDALLDAHRKLPEYLQQRPVPFYVWLRQITWEQLMRYHRRHLEVQARTVHREEKIPLEAFESSVAQLADSLVDGASSPSGRFLRAESSRRVRAALDAMSIRDREVLVLRFVEDLSQAEAAAVLEISEGAVNMRQLRALRRLRTILEEEKRTS